MRRFLVVDDSHERKEKYVNIFNFIELDFAFSSEEFSEKISNKYDGYFVDVIYTDESFQEISFQEILERIPHKRPLFILSSKWQEAMDCMKMRFLRTSGKANEVLGYLSWDNMEDANKIEMTKDFVREQINHYYDLAFDAFAEEQCISILQISDLEFGNPQQETNIGTYKELLLREVRKALRKLGFQQDRVDFICVCGDIGFYGKADEYKRAKEWLAGLGKELLVNSNYENMLIVPGNHDYNIDSVAGAFFSFDKDKKDYQKRKKPELLFHNQAMHNFAKFVYELTGDNSYLINPYRPIVKRTYEDYGMNFILLNPIKIDENKRFKYGLDDKSMECLLEDMSDVEHKESCNMVLSHLSAQMYNAKDPTSDNIAKELENIIDVLDVKGWFYGHSHDKRYFDDKTLGNHKVILSRTSSLMLNNTQHCEGAGNGFTVMKLYRKGGKVTQISYYDDIKETEKIFNTPFITE